jgi:hypothetical protein
MQVGGETAAPTLLSRVGEEGWAAKQPGTTDTDKYTLTHLPKPAQAIR